MKPSAATRSVATFMASASVGLILFMTFKTTLFSWASFILSFVVGSVAAGSVFNRYASLEEKKKDLEERNRNGLG